MEIEMLFGKDGDLIDFTKRESRHEKAAGAIICIRGQREQVRAAKEKIAGVMRKRSIRHPPQTHSYPRTQSTMPFHPRPLDLPAGNLVRPGQPSKQLLPQTALTKWDPSPSCIHYSSMWQLDRKVSNIFRAPQEVTGYDQPLVHSPGSNVVVAAASPIYLPHGNWTWAVQPPLPQFSCGHNQLPGHSYNGNYSSQQPAFSSTFRIPQTYRISSSFTGQPPYYSLNANEGGQGQGQKFQVLPQSAQPFYGYGGYHATSAEATVWYKSQSRKYLFFRSQPWKLYKDVMHIFSRHQTKI